MRISLRPQTPDSNVRHIGQMSTFEGENNNDYLKEDQDLLEIIKRVDAT
eukprot:CAMPEP_0198151450 /NCGR_PEP_ID=MMETSP1443-20131203/55578_1 /TAXON_ID=186043 /ORGANISM="Entomoneis sp., Strain CCMP2396" /LENGTH=48 /DNA_ID= /DNA_START= /DNA_END= /DNA_ORIENTATION=